VSYIPVLYCVSVLYSACVRVQMHVKASVATDCAACISSTHVVSSISVKAEPEVEQGWYMRSALEEVHVHLRRFVVAARQASVPGPNGVSEPHAKILFL